MSARETSLIVEAMLQQVADGSAAAQRRARDEEAKWRPRQRRMRE